MDFDCNAKRGLAAPPQIIENPPIAASLQKIQTLVYFYIHVDLEFFLLLALESF